MSEVVIKAASPKDEAQIRVIFFETSTRKEFASEEEREAFFEKYVGFYLKNYPHLVFVAKSERVLGYVLGSPITDASFYKIQPHLEVFEDLFKKYPGHLHINLSAASQGLGLGQKLVFEFCRALSTYHSPGLHIMTGPESRNQSFYEKLGFSFKKTRNFRGNPILFMGLELVGK